MTDLLHDLILNSAESSSDAIAVLHKEHTVTYGTLAESITRVARGLVSSGLSRGERVAVYLPKRMETVAAIFGITMAGGVFVPVNPILKAEQVTHILRDCNVRVLVTSADRVAELANYLGDCHDLQSVVLVDDTASVPEPLAHLRVFPWEELLDSGDNSPLIRPIDGDMAAIFYTSGSTGNPKGVVLSHRNMVAGADSVSTYLENHAADRLLAALPFSFDYGFSQLSTAFLTGASIVLMDYLFPADVIRAVQKFSVTGLAGVPPLWIQLAKLAWPDDAVAGLRYITNSGGAMPGVTLSKLRSSLSGTQIFLMYGLTEAFRSTYLPPTEVDRRPDSMGKAIPNAEVIVVREDGSLCKPGEPGELVHRGVHVSLGYWNDPEKTAERFRKHPLQEDGLTMPEIAVWSGDTVVSDEAGYLYFVGRTDDMIKTSGYRVSPTEVEEVIYATGLVTEVAAVGVPHPEIGQGIIVAAVRSNSEPSDDDTDKLLAECRKHLATFMIPGHIEWRDSLPRNPNGKIDRKSIQSDLNDYYQESDL